MKDPKKLFKGKKVLILGLGINQGGVGSTKFFINAGAEVKVTDLKKEVDLTTSLKELGEFAGIEYTLGEHKFEDIDWADLIIKNPAIKPDNPYLLHALKANKHVEMDMGIFLQFVKSNQIIGITGTKGKSTTASLIYEILTNGVKLSHTWGELDIHRTENVVLAGNIGKSVLDIVPYLKDDSLVVLELSSFQIESFKTHRVSPHIVVITNIFPDHLNYYKTMDQYIQSKKDLAREQDLNDFLYLKKDDPIINAPEFLKDLEGQIVYFSPDNLPSDFSPKLQGEYNLWNMSAALAVCKNFDIDQDLAIKVCQDFNGVEFRLQLIKEINGIKIYNDSASTIPQSTVEALKSFPNCILICGGMNKNLQFDEMAKAINQYSKMVFFLDGTATDLIKNVIASEAWQSNFNKIKGTYSDLEKLLTDVRKEAKSGDIILFSPGATSFNFFQNEFDRARKFNTAVEKIFV